MFLARSWRLFLGCCLTPWDRAVLRESSIALRRIWAEDMAVERASLWQPFKLTTVTRAVYDPSRQREQHESLRQAKRNLFDDSHSAVIAPSSSTTARVDSVGVQAARPNTLPQQANPAEDATSCCCTRELCVRGARPAVHTVQSGSKAARLSAASHWLGIVAEARTVKRLHAWDLLPPGFRALSFCWHPRS